mmetsp:Transcript_84156/g.123094  ORF Transcript_84156/g.123094 Transcript_84156/m.123094 type:complete len:163 (+) Transcript_84156:368-856(+)
MSHPPGYVHYMCTERDEEYDDDHDDDSEVGDREDDSEVEDRQQTASSNESENPQSVPVGTSAKEKGEILIQAVKDDNTETVVLMLEAGADINRKDEDGMTPLQWAQKLRHIECTRLLLVRLAEQNRSSEPEKGKEVLQAAGPDANVGSVLKVGDVVLDDDAL